MTKHSSRRNPKAPLTVVPPLSTVSATDDVGGLPVHQDTLSEANALRPRELIAVNIDVPRAVATATRALPAILALRDQIVKDLPTFEIANLDRLESFILATASAHAAYGKPAASPELLASLKQQCLALGRTLHVDAVALSARGLVDGAKLREFTAHMSYKTLAFELLGLVSLLRKNWIEIASRTAVQTSELDQAKALARQLLDALGVQEEALASTVKQSEQRQRNFTLFVRAYAQLRRAIRYVCWDQNVDRIAPSLYAARKARARQLSGGIRERNSGVGLSARPAGRSDTKRHPAC